MENVNVKVLKKEESELKFIVVNRNMIQKEATVILEFDKEITSSFRGGSIQFFGAGNDFQITIKINNQTSSFLLSNDPFNLFWSTNGINNRNESRPYTTKEIADTIFEDVLKEVGTSFDE